VRDLDQLARGAELDPTRLIATYREARRLSPGLRLPPRLLATLHAAAVSAGDHLAVVEITRWLIERGGATRAVLKRLARAADAQDALGRPDLAARTRRFLWSTGYRPGQGASSAPPAQAPVADAVVLDAVRDGPAARRASRRAPDPRPAHSAGPRAARDGSDTCAAHGLRAIAVCSQCETPVCAACSKPHSEGRRICQDCAADLGGSREGLAAVEGQLHALGRYWQLAGLTLVAYAPVYLFMPPILEPFGWWILGVLLVLAAIYLSVGHLLAQLRPTALIPAAAVCVFTLLAFPVGTLVGAWFLWLLLRPAARRVLAAEQARLRAMTPELNPSLTGGLRQLLQALALLMGIFVVATYGSLFYLRSTTAHVPTDGTAAASTLKRWEVGTQFDYDVDVEVSLSTGGELDSRTAAAGTLSASGVVLAVDERGWPISVRYQVRHFEGHENGESFDCRDAALVTKPDGTWKMELDGEGCEERPVEGVVSLAVLR
jgi:hypothetical protein